MSTFRWMGRGALLAAACGVLAQEPVVPATGNPETPAVAPAGEGAAPTEATPAKPKPAKPKAPKAVVAPAVPEKPPARAWTSFNGHQITARFVELKDGVVVLEDEAGTLRPVRLSLLLPKDQTVAQELEAARAAGPAADASGTKANRLPVFREGGAKGLHAVYSNANFVATVSASGGLSVTCLDAGAPVGKPITFAPSYGYADKANRNRYVGRRIVSFDKAPKPTLAPTVLAYEATLEDDVKAGFSYEFKGNTVQVWGWVEDPAGIPYPTGQHLRFAFTASHEFANDVLVSERKKVVAPYSLAVTPVDGKTVVHPYGDKVSRFATSARQIAIEGPLFGKRKVAVECLSPKTAPLVPWIYTDYCPYQGYSVGLHKEDRSSRSDRERMILTID